MKFRTQRVVMAAVLAMAGATSAQAQESNLTVVLGVKMWSADWTTWFIEQDANNVDFLQQAPADTKSLFIPQISIRYGNFIGSLSTALKSTHEFRDPGLSYRYDRKEIDGNVGYYLTPGLAATLGYKKFTQSSTGSGSVIYEVAGPTFGLSGSASLSGGFSMYGALGLGALKLKDLSGGNNARRTADYSLSEVGLVYSMPMGRFLKSLSITGGYRTQIIAAKNLVMTDGNGLNPVRQDARDITQGFTLGLVGAF